MIRTLILEDDSSQADILKLHLSRYDRETGRSFSITVLPSAREFIESTANYDLLFLDIQLPGMSGMDAAEIYRQYDSDTPIVFVTDLAQYAINGYQVDAMDYMIKPVTYPDFKIRLDRVIRTMERNANRTIFLPTKEGGRFVSLHDLVCVDVVSHRLLFHMADGESFFQRGTLGNLEKDLSGSTFVRISNSCLINLQHLATVSGSAVIMSDGERCSISRSRRNDTLAAIANYYGGNS